MKKCILILVAFNVCIIELSAQLQAQTPQTKTQIQTDSAAVELDSTVLHHDNLMELGKRNFIEKDSIAGFKGKRFEKAAIDINKTAFDALVEASIGLFKIKKFEQMTDIEHRNIIRAINTISVQKLTGTLYEELEEAITLNDYPVKMTTKFKWTYSQGMGFYFLELGIDLDGSMHNENLFMIKN